MYNFIKVGDILIGVNGNPIEIKKIFDGPEKTVYNFEVKDNHTYIANGFRVHNWKHMGGMIAATPGSGMIVGNEVKLRALVGEYILPMNIVNEMEEASLEALRKGKVRAKEISKYIMKCVGKGSGD